MKWKQFPSAFLSSLEASKTLSTEWVPRWWGVDICCVSNFNMITGVRHIPCCKKNLLNWWLVRLLMITIMSMLLLVAINIIMSSGICVILDRAFHQYPLQIWWKGNSLYLRIVLVKIPGGSQCTYTMLHIITKHNACRHSWSQ